MSDLNLNFDTGVKSITMGNTSVAGNSSGDNLSVRSDSSPMNSSQSPQPQSQSLQPQTTPSLSVSDPVGIEFLILLLRARKILLSLIKKNLVFLNQVKNLKLKVSPT